MTYSEKQNFYRTRNPLTKGKHCWVITVCRKKILDVFPDKQNFDLWPLCLPNNIYGINVILLHKTLSYQHYHLCKVILQSVSSLDNHYLKQTWNGQIWHVWNLTSKFDHTFWCITMNFVHNTTTNQVLHLCHTI